MGKNDDQLDFDFTANNMLDFPCNREEEGYFKFHSEQQQALQELEKKFGVVLNRQVRLRLIGWDEEFEGKLVLDNLLHPTKRSEALRLRMGKIAFDHTNIEFCQVLD